MAVETSGGGQGSSLPPIVWPSQRVRIGPGPKVSEGAEGVAVHILFIADAAPVNVISEGLIGGLRSVGHEVLSYGPGLEVFFGSEVPIRDALRMHNWRGPRFYPDLVWYSESRFWPDWEGLDCPRVLTWACPNCFDGSDMAREADAVFLFRPQFIARVRELNPRTWWVPYGVDGTVYYPDLTAPKVYPVVSTGTPGDAQATHWAELKARLGDRMLFVGEVWGADRAYLYRRSQIVVDWHASDLWSDLTPMAMACGACDVANATPGLVDAFEPGRHFAPYRPESLVETVTSLLADGERRRRIAEEGCREVLFRHTWRQRVDEMISLLDEAKVILHVAKLPSQFFLDPSGGEA